MINNFYSSVSNGNHVETCKNTQHHVPEPLYLLKNNFLNEFRTSLEKAKVRANLGIADSETLYWGNIQGKIEDQADISGYINTLLSFNYEVNHDFNAGDNFLNITNVREAAITCLDYLKKFKGEGAEINAIDNKVKAIILNLYAVDTLDDAATSEGGVINLLNRDVQALLNKIGTPNSTVEEIEQALTKVEEDIESINASLTDINNLIRIYVPKNDEPANALTLVEDTTDSRDGTVLKEGGLYVKDLLPLIDLLSDEISGNADEISILLEKVETNELNISQNTLDIETINETTIPSINEAILNVITNSDNKYVSKESLGTTSPIITEDKLATKLNDYVKINSNASLTGLTSLNDSIDINKSFNPTEPVPLDPRHYVLKKEDLKNIDAWTGMEVIVIDNSLMYICTDASKSKLDTYEAWKPTDSLRIEVLTAEEFKTLKEEDKLNEDIYYFIHNEDVEYTPAPAREEYTTILKVEVEIEGEKVLQDQEVFDQEGYDLAVQNYLKGAEKLGNLYMSALWGEEFDKRLANKADKLDYLQLSRRLKDVEDFFKDGDASDSLGSLSQLKENLYNIYTPANGSVPASGLIVTIQRDINDLTDRVTGLETSAVKWSDIGEGSEIVVKDFLENNYIKKGDTASVEGLIPKEGETSISINVPLNPTFLGPLDARHYVETFAELFAIPASKAYEGMEVIVKQDASIYMLKDVSKITSQEGWEVLGSSSIVELTLEEYQLRKDNTNEDGTSKGNTYQDGALAGQEIPTLLEGTYYFIKLGEINVPVEPNIADFTDLNEEVNYEAYALALEKWRKGTYYLLQQYMSASWGVDMQAKVDTKAGQAELQKTNEDLSDLTKDVRTLQSYFSGDLDVPENNIKVAIANLTSALETHKTQSNTAFDAQGNRISAIETALYGIEGTDIKPEFVTWEALGGGGDELTDGETLFVKTSTYNNDREADSHLFNTEELKLKLKDESSGELKSELSIKPTIDRITLNNKEVVLKDDIKTLEFDSYQQYYDWIKEGSEEVFNEKTYAEWSSENNPNEWYFIIKEDLEKSIPDLLVGETEEEYLNRLEEFKKGQVITISVAEELFTTKGDLSEKIIDVNTNINTAKGEANDYCDEQVNNLDTKLQTAWAPYYNNEYLPLGDIFNLTEERITNNVKTYAENKIIEELDIKLNKSIFDSVWDTYYTDTLVGENNVRTYRSLKDIIDLDVISEINEIKGGSSGLSLNSLKDTLDLKQSIELHNTDINSLREELKEYADTGKLEIINHSDDMDEEYYQRVIEICNNSEPVTYDELVQLKEQEELTPGKYYRITDYETTSKQEGTSVIWHPFNIIVLALDTKSLNEDVYAYKSDDSYYLNCDLYAWKLKYTLDNNPELYYWADNRYTVLEAFDSYAIGDIISPNIYNKDVSQADKAKCKFNGKGVIYYMKDEFGNECSYDFKSILFDRYIIKESKSGKTIINWTIGHPYNSLSREMTTEWGSIAESIDYKSDYAADRSDLRRFYTFNYGEEEAIDLTVYNANKTENKTTCRDNKFTDITQLQNVLNVSYRRNILPCNVFIGESFYSNTIKHSGFIYNTVLNSFSFNTIESNFAFNIFGSNSKQNSFGHDCKFNVVERDFLYNSVSNEFIRNLIEPYCTNNTFGDEFNQNAIQSYCNHNKFGNLCTTNTLCTSVNHCSFENGVKSLTLEIPYIRYCRFAEGMHDLIIKGSRGNNTSWYLYVYFNTVFGTTTGTLDFDNGLYQSPKNEIKILPGKQYITVIENLPNSNICYVWCPAALVGLVISLINELTTLKETVNTLNQTVSNLSSKVQENEAFEDGVAAAVASMAETLNVRIELPTRNLTT